MEELEDRLLALGEHRAKAAAERIEADNEEEERPASAAVSAAMGVIGRGGAMAGERWRCTFFLCMLCAMCPLLERGSRAVHPRRCVRGAGLVLRER